MGLGQGSRSKTGKVLIHSLFVECGVRLHTTERNMASLRLPRFECLANPRQGNNMIGTGCRQECMFRGAVGISALWAVKGCALNGVMVEHFELSVDHQKNPLLKELNKWMTKHSPCNHLRARRNRANTYRAEIADLIQRMEDSFYRGETDPDQAHGGSESRETQRGRNGSQRLQHGRGEQTHPVCCTPLGPQARGGQAKVCCN